MWKKAARGSCRRLSRIFSSGGGPEVNASWHGEQVSVAVHALAEASSGSLHDRLAATKALRAALGNAAAAADEEKCRSQGEEDANNPEPIFVYFSSRKLRLSDMHAHLLSLCDGAAGADSAVDFSSGNEDDDHNVFDDDGYELAADAPIPPQSLTFGTTPFETVAACLDLLRDRYGFEVNPFDDFGGYGSSASGPEETTKAVGLQDGSYEKTKTWLDLGSGDGGPTVAAALLHPWKKCWGVEVRRSKHREAVALAGKYHKWYDDNRSGDTTRGLGEQKWGDENFDGCPATETDRAAAAASVVFDHADLRRMHLHESRDGGSASSAVLSNKVGYSGMIGARRSVGGTGCLNGTLRDVDVLFSHATCFDDGLMQELGRRLAPRLSPGCFLVTASKPVPSRFLQTLETRLVPFSWGVGTVVLQQRLSDDDVLAVADGDEAYLKCSGEGWTINDTQAPASNLSSGESGHTSSYGCSRLLRGLGGNRNPPDYTPALNAVAAPSMFESKPFLATPTTGLSLLVDQIVDGMAAGGGDSADGTLTGYHLALHAAVAASAAAAVEMNARALVSGDGRMLSRGIVNMINLPKELPAPVVAAVQASGCLAASALASHHGCALAVVQSGIADALVNLLMPMPQPTMASPERGASGTGMRGTTPSVAPPSAILGAAAACIARCAELPSFAAQVQARGLVEHLEGMIDDMADNASFCESAGAAIAAIERFAPFAEAEAEV